MAGSLFSGEQSLLAGGDVREGKGKAERGDRGALEGNYLQALRCAELAGEWRKRPAVSIPERERGETVEEMKPTGGVGLPERERESGASGLGWIPDFGPRVWPSWLPFYFFRLKPFLFLFSGLLYNFFI
jgi:hypothetical protein